MENSGRRFSSGASGENMTKKLGDSLEELEKLDIPRGVVAAANRYAAKKVPLVELVKAAKQMEDPKHSERLTMAVRSIYQSHFDSFIQGAKWAHELQAETPE